MDVVMDGLLIAGTLFAGLYCWVLAGRVRALKSLDSGLGGAIVTLTRQIELARATLDEARTGARETRQDLSQLIARADAAAAQLRLLLAAIEKPQAQATLAAAATAPAAPQVQVPLAQAAVQPPASPPAASVRVPRRAESPGPRLVPQPEPEAAEPEADPDARSSIDGWNDGAATLPKPRRTLTLDGLLRRRPAPEAAPAPESEADLIAALTALAAGGDR